MSERKVFNKYYPPDFDPALLPKGVRAKNGEMIVRMMLPMSVRCGNCGEFLYKGKKFNTKKEDVVGQNYLGIQIYRFYFKCSNCSATFSIITDPKNSDYVCEYGATRNFEQWRADELEAEEEKKMREEEEEGNAMKKLENKTLDNKVEMDILEALDEIKALQGRNSKVDPLEVLKYVREEENKELEAQEKQEEEEISKITFKNSANFVKRLVEEDNDENNETGQSHKKIKPEESTNGEKEKDQKKSSFSILSELKVVAKDGIEKKKLAVPKKMTIKAIPKKASIKQEQPSSTVEIKQQNDNGIKKEKKEEQEEDSFFSLVNY